MIMKEAKATIEFYINKDNMEEVLNGKTIVNFDEMHANLFNHVSKINEFFPIYESRTRSTSHKSEYPDINDRIIGKVVRYIQSDRIRRYPALEVEFLDSLYYCKLDNPVIKLNGYFQETEDGNLYMSEITRITLASR